MVIKREAVRALGKEYGIVGDDLAGPTSTKWGKGVPNCSTEGRKTKVHVSTGKLQDRMCSTGQAEKPREGFFACRCMRAKGGQGKEGTLQCTGRLGRETCNLHSHNYH